MTPRSARCSRIAPRGDAPALPPKTRPALDPAAPRRIERPPAPHDCAARPRRCRLLGHVVADQPSRRRDPAWLATFRPADSAPAGTLRVPRDRVSVESVHSVVLSVARACASPGMTSTDLRRTRCSTASGAPCVRQAVFPARNYTKRGKWPARAPRDPGGRIVDVAGGHRMLAQIGAAPGRLVARTPSWIDVAVPASAARLHHALVRTLPSWRPRALSRSPARDPRHQATHLVVSCHAGGALSDRAIATARRSAGPRRGAPVLPRPRDVRFRVAHRLDSRGLLAIRREALARPSGNAIRFRTQVIPRPSRQNRLIIATPGPPYWMFSL